MCVWMSSPLSHTSLLSVHTHITRGRDMHICMVYACVDGMRVVVIDEKEEEEERGGGEEEEEEMR